MASIEEVRHDIATTAARLPLEELAASMVHLQTTAEALGAIAANTDSLAQVTAMMHAGLDMAAAAIHALYEGQEQLNTYAYTVAGLDTAESLPDIETILEAAPQTKEVRPPVDLPVLTTTGRRFTLKNATATPFKASGCEVKHVVQGVVDGVPTSFIARYPDPHYIPAWQAFRAAGLPVVPEVGTTPDGALILTDMKADGSEIYGKALSFVLGSNDRRVRARPELDAHFMRITGALRSRSLKRQLDEYARRATHAGIRLPDDDAFELLVHPDGTWQLITLDLSHAEIHDPATLTAEQKANLAYWNKEYCEDFLLYLRSIRNDLR